MTCFLDLDLSVPRYDCALRSTGYNIVVSNVFCCVEHHQFRLMSLPGRIFLHSNCVILRGNTQCYLLTLIVMT
jgi:hypothetical protein